MKLTTLLLAGLLSVTLAGCGKKPTPIVFETTAPETPKKDQKRQFFLECLNKATDPISADVIKACEDATNKLYRDY